ncbi:MAG TPA: hydroxymethylbilane synthase [Methanobacteriaceae archaeon]|nr:hydroxymethylbilane synthase [Methanobacteriaceae archaeon]
MKVGTRGSGLALAQTKGVIADLSRLTSEKIEIKVIKTTGDKIKNSQLYNMDTKGIFTRELDKALLEEEVDFAVHSLKDLPTDLNEDLEIVAVPPRETPRDALISAYPWDELPENASLGTSSLRREAFCKFHQKKVIIKPIRGNIDTRVRKVENGQYDATLMAAAGLKRLGLAHHIQQTFPIDYITPAAGQGALAIVSRKDSSVKEVLKGLSDFISYQEVTAEKRVLQDLGVGCQWPLGVCARADGDLLDLYGALLTKEGEVISRVSVRGPLKKAEKVGKEAARIMGDAYS